MWVLEEASVRRVLGRSGAPWLRGGDCLIRMPVGIRELLDTGDDNIFSFFIAYESESDLVSSAEVRRRVVLIAQSLLEPARHIALGLDSSDDNPSIGTW